MASYSAVIDLRVNGLNGLKTIDDRVKAIEGVLKQLKPIPSIFDKRAKGEVSAAKNELSNYIEQVGKGTKTTQVFSSTLAGINSQLRAFSAVAANSSVNSDEFKNALFAAEKASIKLTQAEAKRLKIQNEFFTANTVGQSVNIGEILSLEKAVPPTIAGLELYQQKLRETLEQVTIGSNEFKALEEAIAKVDNQLQTTRLAGQRTQIQPLAGPATQLGTVSAFKQRERFESQIEQQLIRQLAVEKRINQANIDENQKQQLRKDLGEATNQLAANELTLAKQLTTEVERQRISLERAKRAREQGLPKGGVRRTGQFTQLTAPSRLKNIQQSAVLLQEKLNTLGAKGVDVAEAKSRVERLISTTQQNQVDLSLKSLNLLDDELNGLRQLLRLESQRLTTQKTREKSQKKAAKASGGIQGFAGKAKGRLGSAAVGAAFPALFGGGPLSIVGGFVGELFGPLGGVVGSAIGQSLETAAKAVTEFGDALRKPTENLEALTRAAGLAGTTAAQSIAITEFLGLPELGGALAASEVEKVVGAEGAENLRRLSKESQELGNNLNKLGSRLQSAFAPLLTQLARFGTFITGGAAPPDPRQRLKEVQTEISDLQDPTKSNRRINRRTVGGRLRSLKEEETRLQKLITETRDIESDITSVIEGRQRLLENATRLETNRLSLRRDSLAFEEGSVRVNQIQQRLNEINLRLTGEITDEKKQQLELEEDALKEQQRAAQAARSNAVRLAEIQILRDKITLSEQILSTEKGIYDVARKYQDITQSESEVYASKLFDAQQELEVQKQLLVSKARSRLLTVNEPEVRKLIISALLEEVKLEQAKADYKKEQARQNELLRRDAVQAVADARDLTKMQTELQARRDISQMDPSRAFQAEGMGLGFFGDSVLLEANLIQDRTVQMQLFNAELENLQNRLKALGTIDPDQTLRLTDQLKDLQSLKATYERVQPAIDAARVKQQQFNDALALTTPVVSSFINGISEVVQGTKSAQEAFADFLRTIGDTLVQEGTRMIATYIAIGIAKAFAGLSGGNASTPDPFSSNVASALPDTGSLANAAASTPLALRASGGPVNRNSSYLVGEQGPELFTPNQAGRISSTSDTRSLLGRSPVGQGAPAMNFTFETTNIGGKEFVDREQLEAAMAVTRRQAANDGASRGMNMTLDKMQHSPSTRRRVGIS